jgi:hypothetical protein
VGEPPSVTWRLDREHGVIVLEPHLTPLPYVSDRAVMRRRIDEYLALLDGAYKQALADAAADPDVRAFYADDPVALRNLDDDRDP